MKIYLGNTPSKFTTRYVDTTSLTFNYTDQDWKFSVSYLPADAQRLISLGYRVRLQLCRKIPGVTEVVKYGKKIGTNTSIKYSHILGAHNIDNDYSIPTSIDITAQVIANPQIIIVNDWMNDLFKYDNWRTYKRNTKAAELTFQDFGYWYRKYSFCILINNVRYGLTSEICVYAHFPGGRMSVDIDKSATTISGLDVHIYELV